VGLWEAISALDIDLGLIARYSEIISLVALDGSFLNKASDGEGAALLVPNSQLAWDARCENS
jgi:hypothetical protein